MKWTKCIALSTAVLLGCGGSQGSNSGALGKAALPFPGELAPLPANFKPAGLEERSFTSGGFRYVSIDIHFQSLKLELDAPSAKAAGKSVIAFEAVQSGRPVLLLDCEVTAVRLNGAAVTHRKISLPGTQKQGLAIEAEVNKGELLFAEIDYGIPDERVQFENGGASLLTSMTDLYGHFFERWAPANFESDQFSLSVRIRAVNATRKHVLFTNGASRELGAFEWEISFPAHYTSSSFYIHLTNRELAVSRFAVMLAGGPVKVIVYSAQSALADQARNALPQMFESIEAEFGPYPHESFTAYITSGTGGMEYVGGTISGLGSLSHELFHSWFARGVMPAEGRSGWIDEAAASWRDYGFPRAGSILQRAPTGLAGYSAFDPATPKNCYRDGRALFAELDMLAAPYGGMKAVLRAFSERYRYRVVTNGEFEAFFETLTNIDISALMERYVLGAPPAFTAEDHDNLHPMPLSRAELIDLI